MIGRILSFVLGVAFAYFVFPALRFGVAFQLDQLSIHLERIFARLLGV